MLSVDVLAMAMALTMVMAQAMALALALAMVMGDVVGAPDLEVVGLVEVDGLVVTEEARGVVRRDPVVALAAGQHQVNNSWSL